MKYNLSLLRYRLEKNFVLSHIYNKWPETGGQTEIKALNKKKNKSRAV